GKGYNDHDRDDHGKGYNDHDRDDHGKGYNDHDRNDYGHGKDIPVHYANAHVPGGFTAVSHDVMANGRPVDKGAVKVPGDALRTAMKAATPVDRVPVEPTRVAQLGSTGRATRIPPSQALDRPVVSRNGGAQSSRGNGEIARNRNQNGAQRSNQDGPQRGTEKPSAGHPLDQQSGSARPTRGENQNAGGPNLRNQLPPS